MSKNAVIASCITAAAIAAGAWAFGGAQALMIAIRAVATALFGISIGCSISSVAKSIASRKKRPQP